MLCVKEILPTYLRMVAAPPLPAAVRRRRDPSPVVPEPCGEEIKRRQKHLSMLLLLQGIRACCGLVTAALCLNGVG